jgi:hypothetical protein
MNRSGWSLPTSTRGEMDEHKTPKDLHIEDSSAKPKTLSQKQVDIVTQYRILRNSCLALTPKQELHQEQLLTRARGGVVICATGLSISSIQKLIR